MPQLFDDTPPECPECPECRERTATPIIYGDPSSEMVQASRLGEIVLGGVAAEGDMPAWLCSCGTRYED